MRRCLNNPNGCDYAREAGSPCRNMVDCQERLTASSSLSASIASMLRPRGQPWFHAGSVTWVEPVADESCRQVGLQSSHDEWRRLNEPEAK